MKKALHSILAALVGLGIGLGAGRMSHPARPAAIKAETAAAPRIHRAVADPAPAHTLRQLARTFGASCGDPELARQLERMTSAELRKWVMCEWPDTGDPELRERSRGLLLGMIAAELYRRDGSAALRWAAALDADRRCEVFPPMVIECAGTDPAMAKPWIDQAIKDYGRIANYWMAAEAGARARGAEELAQVRALYPEAGGGSSVNGARYAAGFDFQKYFSLTAGKVGRSALATWAARDGEAAAAAIIGQSRQSKDAVRYAGALFEGMAAAKGDQEAARWIAAKLDQFPAEARDDAVKSLIGGFIPSRSRVESLLAALPSPIDCRIYAAAVITPYSDPASVLAAMKAFDSVESQTDLLLEMAPRYRQVVSGKVRSRADPVEFFQTTMEKLNLPDSSRQQVMDSLMAKPTDH
jgi:hypothetical protein